MDAFANGIRSFVDELGWAMRGVEITDAAGAPLGFTRGLERVAGVMVAQTAQGRKLMFVGNGASAAISSHQSVDYWKTGGMRAIAFSDPALLTCLGNDYGYPAVFEKPVAMFADAGDVLVAISSSGRSDSILRAVRAARERGCRVLTFSGFTPDNPLRHAGDVNVYAPSKSYGHVEVTHLALLHALLDTIVRVYGAPPRLEPR